MKKMFLLLAVACLVVMTLVSYKASSQEEESELGKMYCFTRWDEGGDLEFVNCNGCVLLSGKSNPTDRDQCGI